jgi:hypothetical protein
MRLKDKSRLMRLATGKLLRIAKEGGHIDDALIIAQELRISNEIGSGGFRYSRTGLSLGILTVDGLFHWAACVSAGDQRFRNIHYKFERELVYERLLIEVHNSYDFLIAAEKLYEENGLNSSYIIAALDSADSLFSPLEYDS